MFYKFAGESIFPDAPFCRILSHCNNQHLAERHSLKRRIMPFSKRLDDVHPNIWLIKQPTAVATTAFKNEFILLPFSKVFDFNPVPKPNRIERNFYRFPT